MNSSWQKCRSAFNHDWLKNQFMPALGKFLNLLDDRIEDLEFERTFISSVLPQWEAHRDEAQALFPDFEKEMSPRQLLDHTPLSRCNEQTWQWLGDLVHGLWLTRYAVRQLVTEATERLEETDTAYNLFQEVLQGCTNTRSIEALRPFREEFSEFRRRCQDLGDAIAKFPRGVKVT